MATNPKPAFEVDKKGLAKLLERRGKGFAVIELAQNAWDENTTRVDITLEPIGGGTYRLRVEDDNPEGFADLRHAYTLFAESMKKGDPTKRGRFNLGEKLVVAVCKTATLATTKGTIEWSGEQRRHLKAHTDAGSIFEGYIRMTKAEADDVRQKVWTLIPPEGITTTFNGTEVPQRSWRKSFDATLRTVVADADGNLKPTTRKTVVQLFEPLDGEVASLYEMGLPVVETGDRFHVNVQQKVPINFDRDNVPPGWLRDVRALVLNASYDIITDDDARATWTTNAIEDELIEPPAVQKVIEARYPNPVRADPSDPESIKRAVSAGYTPVPGGAFSKPAWTQIKDKAELQASSQATPGHFIETSPEGTPTKWVDPADYTPGMQNIVAYARALAERLLDAQIEVRIAKQTFEHNYHATWQRNHPSVLTLNAQRLGYAWFERGPTESVNSLLIHEFAHERVSDHMTDKYIDACTDIGAAMVTLAFVEPEFFERFTTEVTA